MMFKDTTTPPNLMFKMTRFKLAVEAKRFLTVLQKNRSCLTVNDMPYRVPINLNIDDCYNVSDMMVDVVNTTDTLESFNERYTFVSQYDSVFKDIYVYMTESLSLMLAVDCGEFRLSYTFQPMMATGATA